MAYAVHEIFYSLQGEGFNAGKPAVFCRFAGCNIWSGKEGSLPLWGDLAKDIQAYLHVGRVNAARRIALCAAAGADSCDGSSVSRYAVTINRLDAARRQMALPYRDGRVRWEKE